MEVLCMGAVVLLFIIAWIYEKVTGRDSGNSYTSQSSSAANDSSNGTSSKRGYCRICGAEVIVDELPDSISRDAFDQFGLCLTCQWGFFMDNGGHFKWKFIRIVVPTCQRVHNIGESQTGLMGVLWVGVRQ
jgi:hypothetical protein